MVTFLLDNFPKFYKYISLWFWTTNAVKIKAQQTQELSACLKVKVKVLLNAILSRSYQKAVNSHQTTKTSLHLHQPSSRFSNLVSV